MSCARNSKHRARILRKELSQFNSKQVRIVSNNVDRIVTIVEIRRKYLLTVEQKTGRTIIFSLDYIEMIEECDVDEEPANKAESSSNVIKEIDDNIESLPSDVIKESADNAELMPSDVIKESADNAELMPSDVIKESVDNAELMPRYVIKRINFLDNEKCGLESGLAFLSYFCSVVDNGTEGNH